MLLSVLSQVMPADGFSGNSKQSRSLKQKPEESLVNTITRNLALLTAVALLTACAQNSTRIGTNLDLCCPGNYSEYADYGVEVEGMPLFLRDYLVTEFDNAFQEKGMMRNDRFNDVRVILRYNHINLNPVQESIDPFVRMEGMSVELNYIAEIEIEIIETASNRQVWGGSISRIHQVVPGEYMHEGRARMAFEEAFRTVLASYPSLRSDDS